MNNPIVYCPEGGAYSIVLCGQCDHQAIPKGHGWECVRHGEIIITRYAVTRTAELIIGKQLEQERTSP